MLPSKILRRCSGFGGVLSQQWKGLGRILPSAGCRILQTVCLASFSKLTIANILPVLNASDTNETHNDTFNAPHSPSALEVVVLGSVLEPTGTTANHLPTDWRLEECQIKLRLKLRFVKYNFTWLRMVEEVVRNTDMMQLKL